MADEQNQDAPAPEEVAHENPTDVSENQETAPVTDAQEEATPAQPADATIPTSDPEEASKSEEDPTLEGPAFVGVVPAPSRSSGTQICEAATEAFGSRHFAEFIGRNVLDFIDIADIADVRRRRATMVALHLPENGIAQRIALSESFIDMEEEYGLVCGSPEMVAEARSYRAKLQVLKTWLCA